MNELLRRIEGSAVAAFVAHQGIHLHDDVGIRYEKMSVVVVEV
jgi:hypothetical protein